MSAEDKELRELLESLAEGFDPELVAKLEAEACFDLDDEDTWQDWQRAIYEFLAEEGVLGDEQTAAEFKATLRDVAALSQALSLSIRWDGVRDERGSLDPTHSKVTISMGNDELLWGLIHGLGVLFQLLDRAGPMIGAMAGLHLGLDDAQLMRDACRVIGFMLTATGQGQGSVTSVVDGTPQIES